MLMAVLGNDFDGYGLTVLQILIEIDSVLFYTK